MLRFGRTRCRLTVGAAFLWSAAAGAPGCAAAPLRLPDIPYHYTVIDQDLAAALQEFGANLGLKVGISPEVKGRIQGRTAAGTALAFLDQLTSTYNLEWYYDGSILSITTAKENRTELLVLSPIGHDTFKAALDTLQISDPRFPIRFTPGKGVAMVSGPPRYIALVEQALAGLVAEEQARSKPVRAAEAVKRPPPAGTTALTVFRGGSMTVIRDGRSERFGDRETEVPAGGTAPAIAVNSLTNR